MSSERDKLCGNQTFSWGRDGEVGGGALAPRHSGFLGLGTAGVLVQEISLGAFRGCLPSEGRDKKMWCTGYFGDHSWANRDFLM